MQIKEADDKQPQIEALKALLGRPDVDRQRRGRIESEIRAIQAGQAGERDAAYLIEFYCGNNPNYMTVHDLRIECGGRVAQIDHLLISRLMEFWVWESKSFREGVAINERGEWSAYCGRHAQAIPSPIEQNRRHIVVLRDVFSSHLVPLPTRLGLALKPEYKSVILVADRAPHYAPKGPGGRAGRGAGQRHQGRPARLHDQPGHRGEEPPGDREARRQSDERDPRPTPRRRAHAGDA